MYNQQLNPTYNVGCPTAGKTLHNRSSTTVSTRKLSGKTTREVDFEDPPDYNPGLIVMHPGTQYPEDDVKETTFYPDSWHFILTHCVVSRYISFDVSSGKDRDEN